MHHFDESLAISHRAEDLPLWREAYEKAFPTMSVMVNHRQDGQHQRNGIDRSIVLSNGKTIWVDEKVRGRNKKTGKVYGDIALEYLSDERRQTQGWVCKPLMADYIAYAIAPLGKCYMLPVLQLQSVWRTHGRQWLRDATYNRNDRRILRAENVDKVTGYRWWTCSVAVEPAELFPLIGGCLRLEFTPCELDALDTHN